MYIVVVWKTKQPNSSQMVKVNTLKESRPSLVRHALSSLRSSHPDTGGTKIKLNKIKEIKYYITFFHI